jgi:hypothetical protein
MRYETNPMEADADREETRMDGLLQDPTGQQFLPIYNSKGLQASLGLPIQMTYRGMGASQYELDFQFGTMAIQCSSGICV